MRVGIFVGVAPTLAGACKPTEKVTFKFAFADLFAVGGLLASGLLRTSDIGTVTSWRKIFLVEGTCSKSLFVSRIHHACPGIITTSFGLLCIIVIPTDPQKTRMLTEPERALALARLSADQAVATRGRKERTTLRLVIRAFNLNVRVATLS